MKKFRIFLISFLFASSTLILGSCSKDDDCDCDDNTTKDIRKEILGNYEMTFKMYHYSDGEIGGQNGSESPPSTFIVNENTSNDFAVNFLDENNEEVFKGVKLSEEDGKIFFDIPYQRLENFMDFGESTAVETFGYEKYVSNGIKYHGTYDKTSEKIKFTIKLDVDYDDYYYDDVSYIVIYEGEKD